MRGEGKEGKGWEWKGREGRTNLGGGAHISFCASSKFRPMGAQTGSSLVQF